MKLNRKQQSLIIIILLAGIIGLISPELIKKFEHKKEVSQVKIIPVYFVKRINSKTAKIIPLHRQMLKGKNKVAFAINELLAGPNYMEQKKGFYSEIPPKTKVIEIKTTSKYIIVNLSKDFTSGGGSETMTKRVNQLIYTVVDNSDQKPVYLELNGKKTTTIGGEGIEITQPLSKKN